MDALVIIKQADLDALINEVRAIKTELSTRIDRIEADRMITLQEALHVSRLAKSRFNEYVHAKIIINYDGLYSLKECESARERYKKNKQ